MTAHLLVRYRRLYPSLQLGVGYPVVGQEPTGIWLDAPGGGIPGQLFVFREHFEVV